MQINFTPQNTKSNTTPQFGARAPIIRDTEKICRLINSEFPAISSTKISEFDNTKEIKAFQNLADYIYYKIKTTVRDPAWKAYNKTTPEDFYIKLVEMVKTNRVANCADFSKLCNLICKINGIKSQKCELTLVSPEGRLVGNIDHAIHAFRVDNKEMPIFAKLGNLKNTIIIDPWLGFAEFAPNTEIKFKSEFNKFFQIPDGYSIALNTGGFGEPEIPPESIEKLRKLFPNLILKKK